MNIKFLYEIVFVVFTLIFKLSYSVAIYDNNEINELWKDITTNSKQNKLRRYMIFEINSNEINDPDYFTRLLTDFFLSNGYQSGLYNIKNKLFIAYLSKKDNIKIKSIRDYFGKAFNKIYWFNRNNIINDFRDIKSDL